MTFTKKNRVARSSAATALSCLCFLVVLQLAAATAGGETTTFGSALPASDASYSDTASYASDSSSIDTSTSTSTSWDDAELEGVTDQPPRVALSEKDSDLSTDAPSVATTNSAASGTIEFTAHESNNNNDINNNFNNIQLSQGLSSQDICRPSMASNCRPLLAAQEMDAGQVCFSVADGDITLKIQAAEFWSIQSVAVWMAPGSNALSKKTAATTSTPTAMVPLKEGKLDLSAFTIQSQPNLHQASWETTVTSPVDCISTSSSNNNNKDSNTVDFEEEERSATMVVRAVMAEINDKGKVIPGTQETAFAYGEVASASANYEEESIYGFLDLSLTCPCTTTLAAQQNNHQQQKEQDFDVETYVARRLDTSSASLLSLFSSPADQRRLAYSASHEAFHRRDNDASGRHHRVLQTQVEPECMTTVAYYAQKSACLQDLGYTGADFVETAFSNGPFPSNLSNYELQLYTDEAGCNVAGTDQVGTVKLNLDGQEATVAFDVTQQGFYLKKTQVYAGLSKTPPSSEALSNVHEFQDLNQQAYEFTTGQFDFGDSLYIVAEATICKPTPKVYIPGVSKPCLPTRSHSGKECFPLLAEGGTVDAGQLCIEMVRGDLQVSYSTFGDWVLDSASFWLGLNHSDVPTVDGSVGSLPKEDAFPYFYCNFTGADRKSVV